MRAGIASLLVDCITNELDCEFTFLIAALKMNRFVDGPIDWRRPRDCQINGDAAWRVAVEAIIVNKCGIVAISNSTGSLFLFSPAVDYQDYDRLRLDTIRDDNKCTLCNKQQILLFHSYLNTPISTRTRIYGMSREVVVPTSHYRRYCELLEINNDTTKSQMFVCLYLFYLGFDWARIMFYY